METLADNQVAELVRQLARSHFEIEEGVDRIIWVKNGSPQDVRLIEINRDAIKIAVVKISETNYDSWQTTEANPGIADADSTHLSSPSLRIFKI